MIEGSKMRRCCALVTAALMIALAPTAVQAKPGRPGPPGSLGSPNSATKVSQPSSIATGLLTSLLGTHGAAGGEATGLIVSAAGPVPDGVIDQVSRLLGRTIVGQSEVGDSQVALHFDRQLPASVVGLLAGVLSGLAVIGAVEPDLAVKADSIPNDPYFNRQTNLWTPSVGAKSDGSPAPPTFTIGAPTMWDSTTGQKSVVVAVIDGGIVKHPDLTGQTVNGYDMIADSRYAHDGNGRDSDPSDPGSWSDGTYCAATSSEWHGTHVAGIVAARSNNKIGISGVAPGVSLQAVRVLGRCVGSMSDVADGIRWAAGGHVSGVPDNRTPAKVINVSLSSTVTDRSCPATYQDAIDDARSHGAVVVASAGNQSTSVMTRTPANCAGVLSVGASAPDGSPTTYTNAGSTLGIMAPGGEVPGVGPGIWSTIDAGTKGPTKSTYAEYAGTSMAAPMVSAAAALIFSLGDFTADQVIQTLKASADRPPTFDSYYSCFYSDDSGEHNVCGAGILDLANIPAPVGTPALAGGTNLGDTVSFVPGHWNGHPDDVTFQWLRNGAPIDGETGATHVITADDLGAGLSVRSTAHESGFPDFDRDTLTMSVPKVKSTVTLALSSKSAKVKTTRLIATVKVGTSQPQSGTGELRILVDGKVVATTTVDVGSTSDVTLPAFTKTGTRDVTAEFMGTPQVSTAVSSKVSVKVSK